MPAVSQAQQRFMGMVHAEKEGKLDKSKLDPEFAAKIERIAARIKAKAARDYAETKHKNLPKKKKSKKSVSPPEGDSRGQNKKAEYIMSKIAKNNKDSYPKDIKQTPSPHLVWKPLMRKFSPWKDWGHDAIKTKGVGAVIERILPFGNSGRHWPAEDNEVINKVPGTKGVIQRILPGGKTGFELEKKGAVNKQLAKLTQETFKYYKYVKKESTKMARIKAANARDNSSWPKYVLDKMEKTFKSKKAPVQKVVQAPDSKRGQQMELFSKKAAHIMEKISEYSQESWDKQEAKIDSIDKRKKGWITHQPGHGDDFNVDEVISKDGVTTWRGKEMGTYTPKKDNFVNKVKEVAKGISFMSNKIKNDGMTYMHIPNNVTQEVKFREDHGGVSSKDYYKKWGHFYGINPETTEHKHNPKKGGSRFIWQ